MIQATRIPVAIFLTSFETGGSERQMTELARRLDRSRFDVRVACSHRRGPWLERVASEVTEIAEFPIRSLHGMSTIAQVGAFARWCRARHIAVVQSADLYTNAFALPAARLGGVAVRVGSRREVHPTRGRGLALLQRTGYASAHRIIANSEAGAARLRQEGISPDRIAVVRNGLDVAVFARRSFSPRRRRILTVGRLRPEKAHEVLLAAVRRVAEAWPDVELRVAGDGPREAALRQAAVDFGIAGRVQFLGQRDDVPALLGEADVFVLPSRIEAAPNAVLEAMAAGVPVVASNVGGIPEVVTDGITGLLVPPDDPDALAGALFRIFDDPQGSERLALAARRHVERYYSFDRMVSSFEKIYVTELARHGYLRKVPRLAARNLSATS